MHHLGPKRHVMTHATFGPKLASHDKNLNFTNAQKKPEFCFPIESVC